MLALIFRIIFCFLPVKQILITFRTNYLVIDQDKYRIDSGYYLKKDIKKIKAKLEAEEITND
jgi:hypothetical protein